MTSTRNGPATDPLRHFPTPRWAIEKALPELPLNGVIVDAGCGEGAILELLAERAAPGAKLVGIELQEQLAATAQLRVGRFGSARVKVICSDFLHLAIAGDLLAQVSLVISNPPFAKAIEFIRKALEITAPSNGTVAMLLRNDWVAARERTAFVTANPSDKLILNRRPQFRAAANGKRGSDSCDYSWDVYGPGRGGRWKILDCPAAPRRLKKKGV